MKQHVKKWWKHWVVILSIIAAVLSILSAFTGWFTPKEEIKPFFVCSDGTIASAPENCPCNEDGICQEIEKCDCEDCGDTVECVVQRIKEKEYLFLIDDPKRISGKRVTVKEITRKGSVTIEVEGAIRKIPTTKRVELIKGLRISTQEIVYNYLSPKDSMVIIRAEPL